MLNCQITRTVLSGLVLLLATQLTGLNCLNDWQHLVHSPELSLNSQLDGPTPGVDGLGEDGCPCHLAFVSIARNDYEIEAPASILEPSIPVNNLSAYPPLPFHPPLSA